MLVDSYVELKQARLLVYEAACKMDAGEDTRVDAYICKSNADEMAFRVVDRCMQVFGGHGYTHDWGVDGSRRGDWAAFSAILPTG